MVFFQNSIPPGAYEIQSLNNEIKRIIADESQFIGTNYPFTRKPNFSTLGSILEISKQEPLISFPPVDSIRIILGFNAGTIYKNYTLSPNPVVISSFDNIFLECEFAQGTIFRGKRGGKAHNFTMDVDRA